MKNSIDLKTAELKPNFMWVNLTEETHIALVTSAAENAVPFEVHSVREPALISAAIQLHAPLFVCFEFDEPDAKGMSALAQIRREHPGLPILMIVGSQSHAVALWALRIRVWDLLVKPVSSSELGQRISSIIEMTRLRGREPSRDIQFPPQVTETIPVSNGQHKQSKTQRAIAHVARHFGGKIAINDVAALCRLSPSQFCRVFRGEQGVSFGQHLLGYRIARACEQLADPAALAKEVAYAVGFNDLSHFARVFKRQIGICPSKYRAVARLS